MGQNAIRKVVFIPPVCTYTERKPRRVVYLPTKNGKRIPAYYIPSKDRKRKKIALIYSHGNATDIGAMNDFLNLLHQTIPVNILHYEYIGYGLAKKEGTPTEQHCYESIEAGMKYLMETKGFKPEDVIAYGTSVGGGPTTHLVTKFPNLRGVILESTFTSCCRVVVDKRKVLENVLEKTLDLFLNLKKIGKTEAPVLIFHGVDDGVVPFSHGMELWKRVPKEFKYRKIWVKGADHHDLIEVLKPEEYVGILRGFIKYMDENEEKFAKIRRRLQQEREKGGGGGGGLFRCSGGSAESQVENIDFSDDSLTASSEEEEEDDDDEPEREERGEETIEITENEGVENKDEDSENEEGIQENPMSDLSDDDSL